MLKQLVIRDFKSFREETINFSPSGLTVLVGPNGSGKSSVLDAAFYSTFSYFPALPAQPGAPLVRKSASGFELRLEVEAPLSTVPKFAQPVGVETGPSIITKVNFDGQRRLRTSWVQSPAGSQFYLVDDLTQHPISSPASVKVIDLEAVARAMPIPRHFDVDLRALRWPLRPRPNEVADFGADQVIQVLFDLKLGSDPDAINRLIAKVQKVVPSLRGLGIQRHSQGSTDQYTMTFNMTTGADIDASQVSEGTLLAVALLAAAENNGRRTLLLVDDLDRALHPTAQREMVKLLKAAVTVGNLEIICTTHSPYILSEFEYEQVRVLKEVDGESRCMSLADGPEATRWMKELDAGEYWSFIEHKIFQKGA